MNHAALRAAGLTENEIQLLELGRELKTRTGEGSLLVEYRNGLEALLTPAPKIKPRALRKASDDALLTKPR